MLRKTLLLTAMLLAAAGTVLAQSDPITERKELMKAQGQQLYAVINGMNRGRVPFDAAKANAAMDVLAGTAPKIATLFPDSSKPTKKIGDYNASPKIWENKADFEKKAADLVKAIAENRDKAKTADGLKQAYANINGACGACHDSYAVRN